MSVFLRIDPNSKACRTKGWSDPSYLGLSPEQVDKAKWLGLRTDRLVVIDCDSQEACSWWLERIGLPMEHTYTVRTTNGWHFYYSWTPGSPTAPSIGKVHDKLDVKAGIGSLVVIPPSPGKEELFDIPILPFKHNWIPAEERSVTDDYEEIPDGRGNNTMAALGGALRKQGFSESLVERSLLALNPVVMPTAPMPVDTVVQIAASVSRYETSPDWDIELDEDDDGLGDVEVDDEPALFTLVSAAARAERPEPVWSIQHVIPEQGVGQVYGDTYTGKSLVALDMALSIGNDSVDNWYAHIINHHGDVVYVLMEGVFDLNLRIAAWLEAHPGMTQDRLYTIEEENIDLRSIECCEKILRTIEMAEIDPKLIIIDTQSLAAPGTDENSNTEMNEVFGNLKKLGKAVGAPIYTVHHTGYDTSHTRGASAQKAAVDFQIQVKYGELKVEKVKGYKPTAWYKFELAGAETVDSVWARPMLLEQSPSQRILDLHSCQPLTVNQGLQQLGDSKALRAAYKSMLADGDIETENAEVVESGRTVTRKVVVVTGDGYIEVDFSHPAVDKWGDGDDD